MNKMKGTTKFFMLAFGLILGLFAISTSVLADDIASMTVYVEGNAVWYGSDLGEYQIATPALERDSYMTVKVVFTSNIDLSDVRVKAWIYGYRDEIEDATGTFDVFKGIQYTKTLVLKIPDDIEAKDDYTLHVRIEHKKEISGPNEAEITTTVQRIDNKLKILNIDLWSYQGNEKFKAGNNFYVDVVLKNIGNHLAEDVFIKVSIPALGITRTVYVGDIGSYDDGYDDTVKKTIVLTLPKDAKAGSYKLKIEACNSELHVEETKSFIVEAEEEAESAEGPSEGESKEEISARKFDWENVAMIISIVLAAAIIVLLVVLLVKQKDSEEKPEEAESYY